MNAIFFGLKRAYHGTLRTTRRALARLGLTPARFDLLYIVAHAADVAQSDLRRALGVAASTVSRMLRSLEDLGLIQREPLLCDLRHKLVYLTPEGKSRVRRATGLFIDTGWEQLAVDSALCPEEWHSETVCRQASEACDQTLCRFRHAYGDVATLDYPRSLEFVLPTLEDFDRAFDRWERSGFT